VASLQPQQLQLLEERFKDVKNVEFKVEGVKFFSRRRYSLKDPDQLLKECGVELKFVKIESKKRKEK